MKSATAKDDNYSLGKNETKANTLRKLNEDLLVSAENVLNKIDWNKYR